ncbi:MAG: hydroxyisourate hydrolase [Pseudomonadota bacterium]
MAIVSSHTLNGVDGTHAGGIGVSLSRILDDGGRARVFEAEMDDGGRLSQTVDLTGADPSSPYEMVFATGPYWAARQSAPHRCQIMGEVVVRFVMPDADAKYHIPVILSPNSYSVWWSS